VYSPETSPTGVRGHDRHIILAWGLVAREAIHYKARAMLDELATRRGDWSVIPLASAELAEQELAQGDLKEDQIQASAWRRREF